MVQAALRASIVASRRVWMRNAWRGKGLSACSTQDTEDVYLGDAHSTDLSYKTQHFARSMLLT
jgi:cytochrome c biogenesis protein ResB